MKRHLPNEKNLIIVEGDFRIESGRMAATEILQAKKLPTAVVVANDMMALGAMQEFKAAGLKIPQDISIVGFDDIADEVRDLRGRVRMCLVAGYGFVHAG